MWLTGFDAPCAHTMYVDKPMHGHGLMQAIARVNRVFKQKPGGLIVDYIGIGDALKQALRTYTQSGGQGKTTIDAAEAIAALQKHYELCCDMLHGLDYTKWTTGTAAERATLPQLAQEHILGQDDGKTRWMAHVSNLSKASPCALRLTMRWKFAKTSRSFRSCRQCSGSIPRQERLEPNWIMLSGSWYPRPW